MPASAPTTKTPALQLAALKKSGCRQTFTDHGLSGATTRRPALACCLKALEHGDTLTVWKLDRLGRSVRDLLNILHDIQARGVRFQSITEAIDTETPTGRAMLHMVALLAELERGLITERTRAGMKAAKRRGVKFGRKPKLSSEDLRRRRGAFAGLSAPMVRTSATQRGPGRVIRGNKIS
jgi:DNA invertase Pin-like site-specific DNA recombinase